MSKSKFSSIAATRLSKTAVKVETKPTPAPTPTPAPAKRTRNAKRHSSVYHDDPQLHESVRIGLLRERRGRSFSELCNTLLRNWVDEFGENGEPLE